ncbi:MAG: hypothetical protein JNL11_16275 [Bdellovibrionaceae bacterium]|nr:hypothetical protein [Pseudobdellovibrionaceae bacterium]
MDASFLSLLQCPQTKKDLRFFQDQLVSQDNKNKYPIWDQVPWVFPEPDHFAFYWQNKKNEFLNFHKIGAQNIGVELKSGKNLSSLTVSRLELLKKAHETNFQNLSTILKSLDQRGDAGYEVTIPSHQSLHIYRKNIFRDWGWETKENKISVDLITEVLGVNWTPARFCVLGAGASRLAMDLHKEFRLPLTVAVDFNPLLLMVADKMLKGERLFLYDFSAAAVEIESVVKLYELKSPLGPMQNFYLLCADVTDLPFKPYQFQSVLTPWLIDILPFNFRLLAQRVNQMLEIGGDWINFGPMGFSHQEEAFNLTRPEVHEQMRECGFELEIEKVSQMKYLSADDEVNSRNETVYVFKAKKIETVAVDGFSYLPSWLTDMNQAIPLSEALKQHQQLIRFHADLFHSINGHVSVNQIAHLFSSHYKLPVETARSMALSVLRQYEESLKRK